MYINIKTLVQKYNLKIKGILHIGAHLCEEEEAYLKYIPKNKIIWIEGNTRLYKKCKKDKDRIIYNYLVSDKDDKKINFNISNFSQSSSILEFGTHSNYYNDVKYIGTVKINSYTVKKIYEINDIPKDFANFLNIDIQGAELLALKGMGDILSNFDYLYLEVNKEDVYKDCAHVEEIDEYVKKFGFQRIETYWTPQNWGDAFYIKT